MTYTITVCKYGYELMVVNMPEDYTLTEDVERDDVDELGDIIDCYVCVDEARVIVEDDKGNVVFDDQPQGIPDRYLKEVDATQDYTDKTVLHEIGWRTQTYESETLPTYLWVDFGKFKALCLNTEEMEFSESWDGRYEEILLVND